MKTQMKHTPGNWSVRHNPDGMVEVWAKQQICTIAFYPDYPGKQYEPKANASLIAASPDLFLVCNRLASWENQPIEPIVISELIRQAIAAIALANRFNNLD